MFFVSTGRVPKHYIPIGDFKVRVDFLYVIMIFERLEKSQKLSCDLPRADHRGVGDHRQTSGFDWDLNLL